MTKIQLGPKGDILSAENMVTQRRIDTPILGEIPVETLTFNEPTSQWVITKWDGWFRPKKRTTLGPRAAGHGSVVGPGWFDGRIITLEGHVPVASNADRHRKAGQLAALETIGAGSNDQEPLWLAVTESSVMFVAGVVGDLSVTQVGSRLEFSIEFWAPHPAKMRLDSFEADTLGSGIKRIDTTGRRTWLKWAAGDTGVIVVNETRITLDNTKSYLLDLSTRFLYPVVTGGEYPYLEPTLYDPRVKIEWAAPGFGNCHAIGGINCVMTRRGLEP